MATYVKWLKELNSASESEVGYKVASLGEMLNAGLPVPNGFVVLPSAFQKDKLPEDAREEIEAAYSMLDSNPALRGIKLAEKLISTGRELPFVAVRCSGKAIQNIKGNNNLLSAICELFKNKKSDVLIVQKQINSEKCGTILADESQISINAIYGLGGLAEIGKQTAYLFDAKAKKPLETRVVQDFLMTRDEFNRVVKKSLSDAQRQSPVLAENELNVLLKLAQKVESHYKSPQQISWAIERGKVFMLQVEPAAPKAKAAQKNESETNYDVAASLKFMDEHNGPNVSSEIVSDAPASEASAETKTKLLVNLSSTENAESMAKLSDGIGLLKVHKINIKNKVGVEKYLRENKLDEYETMIYRGIRDVVSHFAGKPATIRVSNILALLKPEFSAIKKLHGEGFAKVLVALPLVVSVDEVKNAKEILREAWFGDKSPVVVPVKLGICIETPASVLIIEYLCREGIDFVHINTNDLAKTILLSDRKKSNLSVSHPAVLRAIEHVVKVCKSHKVSVSADVSDTNILEKLINCGVDSISANESMIASLRKNIFEIELSQL